MVSYQYSPCITDGSIAPSMHHNVATEIYYTLLLRCDLFKCFIGTSLVFLCMSKLCCLLSIAVLVETILDMKERKQ